MSRKHEDLDFDNEIKKSTNGYSRLQIFEMIAMALGILVLIILLVFLVKNRLGAGKDQDTVSLSGDATEQAADGEWTDDAAVADDSADNTEDDSGDPLAGQTKDEGAAVDVTEILSAATVAENGNTTVGIDVAKYQGTIDWAKVASSGIDFAMIRVGYRTTDTGEIRADSNAKYNMQEASANGIKVGVYFVSTAVTGQEAEEEADWVADYIAQYPITYPVAYNCEGFDQSGNRQNALTATQRSDIAEAFLNRIYEKGYTPMFYAAASELQGDAKWDTSSLEKSYKIWVARYQTSQSDKPDYSGAYAMWQYTNKGSVDGISQPVDIDIAYFGYEGTEAAKNSETPDQVTADAEALMNFTEVNETVTAKDTTNLRSIPSQGSDSTILATLKNGETATRTGTSTSGWSRLTYNGQTCYAVSSYLTTDLSAPAQSQNTASEGSGSGDGLKTQFTDCQDQVTAKIEVNLRALPSVTNPDATVVAVLHNGETVTRTGINTDYGWSRVDYNGQTLYCITSYLSVVE
jgi:GH25 family lysozyme M1 (1,4-beta-N-acetylmuramidase)